MNVDGAHMRTIWLDADGRSVRVIDQTQLPHRLAETRLETFEDAARAISGMIVRGAPLIGATGAWGMALAAQADPSDAALTAAAARLSGARPTAVNLAWAVERLVTALLAAPPAARRELAFAEAARLCDSEAEACAEIGRRGAPLIARAATGARPVEILTHCNAGWLACVDFGTALAPIYQAHDDGVPVHVWVDETRPRNQGASLTAWELQKHGVPFTVIPDNAGGHLMRAGRVDLCIVGSDRVAANGDVCNKIGTYLKALAAKDAEVPFYVALPASTIDFTLEHGDLIPIEERAAEEVTHVSGLGADGRLATVRVVPDGAPAANFGFDVTPARLVTALITEHGVHPASADGLAPLRDSGPAARR